MLEDNTFEDKNEEIEEIEELYEHHRFVADAKQSLLRIDKFLINRIENTSRNKIQNAAKAGNILVNELAVKQNYKVKPGDIISVVMSEPPREIEIIPQDIELQIIYEDEDIIIINKEPGMVVHPAYGNYTGTLVNALSFLFLPFQQSENPPQVCLVHRIDKDTSGVMIVAKNEFAQTKLAHDFFHRTIERKYQALVWGNLEDDSGTITGHIGRSLKDRKVMTVFPDGEYGKHAITHWKMTERFGYVSLVECQLETGRTHQIRAHMKYIGHPLFNDATYGGDQILKGTTFTKYRQFIQNCFKIIPRQALHAKSLGFMHPTKNEKMHIETELPQDMLHVIEKWRAYAIHKSIDELV